MQLERARAAFAEREQHAAGAEARMQGCRKAAGAAQQAVVESDAAVEGAVDELTDAVEVCT